MKKLILLMLLSCSAYAQDPFTRTTISAERINANRSYTVKVSTDSTPPPLGFIKLWARDTGSVFLIFPTGYRVNLKLVAAGIGTVTQVSGTSPDVIVTSGTTTPIISINAAGGNGRLIRFDALGRYPPADGSLITGLSTGNISEVTNLYYTTARAQADARTALSGSGIITYNSSTGNFSVNAQAIVNAYIADQTITNTKIAPGNVVKSLNGLTDNVKLVGSGGATVSQSNDTIYVNAGTGSGSGDSVTAIQSTGTITVTNPSGPTVTIDVATNGIDSNKIKLGNVTSTDIKDGDINSVDFAANAKVPLATLADSAVPRGAAGGDLVNSFYPIPVVGTGKINSAKILDGSIVRGDLSPTIVVPYADTASEVSALVVRGTVLLPASGDTLRITPLGVVNYSTLWRGEVSLNNQGDYGVGMEFYNGYILIFSTGDETNDKKVSYILWAKKGSDQ